MVARNYVKVCRGFQELFFMAFWPGTDEEAKALKGVELALDEHPDAKASVWTKCFGPLSNLPVVGDCALMGSTEPEQTEPVKVGQLSPPQFAMLRRMVEGPIVCVYHEIPTGRALVRRDYAELISDPVEGEYRIKIAATGLAKLEAVK